MRQKQQDAFPFVVDESSDVPLWVQLRQRIMHLISTGYFKPGDKLPTVRGLAQEVSINYNTVNKAYLSLVSDGILESARGRGVFVRDVVAEEGVEHAQEVEGILDDCISACRDLGLSLEDIQQHMTLRQRQHDAARRRKAALGSRQYAWKLWRRLCGRDDPRDFDLCAPRAVRVDVHQGAASAQTGA